MSLRYTFQSSVLVVWLSLVVSCAPAKQPADMPQATPDTPQATESEPQAEQVPTGPTVPTKPYAEVLDVLPGKDHPDDLRVHIEIFNPTGTICQIKGYTLRWESSSKEMPLDELSLEPGHSRQRFLIVHPRDGELETLSTTSAAIDLNAECP